MVASETEEPGSSKDLVVTLLRGLRLLDCFAPGRPEMTLPELVKAGGYSKTSTYRFLVTLVEAGWLERTSTAAFRLTLKAFQVGSIAVDSLDVRREALPLMGALAAETGESVYLVVPDADRAVCLERVDGGVGPRLAILNVGGTQQLHLGAGPRALLAFREDDLLPVADARRFGAAHLREPGGPGCTVRGPQRRFGPAATRCPGATSPPASEPWVARSSTPAVVSWPLCLWAVCSSGCRSIASHFSPRRS